MNSGFRQPILSFALLALPVLGVHGQSDAARIRAAAQMIVSAYNDREFPRIYQRLGDLARAQISSQTFAKGLDDLYQKSGKLVKLGEPAFFPDAVAIYPLVFEHDKGELRIGLDSDGTILGMELNVVPPQPVASNTVELKLPFKGEWIVLWGGDEILQNYHQSISIVRNAIDVTGVDETGSTHRGDGNKNSDYYGFGREILAPAGGVVTDVISGVRDNVPGVINNFADIGNMVMIRHSTGEVSVFAHLQFASVTVKVGDHVKQGQSIGRCGNSGNSSAPHLHFQLQATNVPTPERTIRTLFAHVMVKENGVAEVRARYLPTKGAIIRPVN